MNDDITKIEDLDLRALYKKGVSWLNKNEQVSDTDKNASGEKYDPELYLMGLKRIGDISDQMRKRNMKI